ncbi:MAG: hypothetical protein DHS20C19_05170 [Acidimicrobiales bacterium]|nr:MAG: hypothetical protein DHS20C19_05170 [Acidimicrobiales bacterium]
MGIEIPATPSPIFFVHVMKTGGTALIRALSPSYSPQRCYPTAAARFAEKGSIDAVLERTRGGAEFDLLTPHVPAWVAEEVAPQHLHVTVLREPTARTISHLRQVAAYEATPDDLEAIYEIPAWRDRLRNYQTRLFSADESTYRSEREAAGPADSAADADPEEVRTVLLSALATGVLDATTMVDADLDRAVLRLRRMDVVGVTERLDSLATQLTRRAGVACEQTGRVRVSSNRAVVSASLINAIEADTMLDRELYEHACKMSEDR